MDRLPDPILELILIQISNDAKELFACSSVSKRFGTLILHARNTLSVQVPDHCFGGIPSSDSETLKSWGDVVQNFFKSFRHFVKQFGCIGTLYLRLPLSQPIYQDSFEDPFVKWEFHFKYPKSVRHGLVLSAKSFTTINDDEEKEEDRDNYVVPKGDMWKFENSVHACLLNLRKKWDHLGVPLLKMDVRVDKAVVMDNKDQGMLVIERLDGPLFLPNKNQKYMLSYTKSYTLIWYLPVLRLPEGRGVLKGVKLCFIQTGNDSKLVFPARGMEMNAEEAAKKIMPTGGVHGKDMDFLREAAKKIMEKRPHSCLCRHHLDWF